VTSPFGVELPTIAVDIAFTAAASVGTYLLLDDPARGLIGTGTLAPADVWADVTGYVETIAVASRSTRTTGPLVRYDASTFTITLNNSDRRFDPSNLTGPYVSGGATQVTPMRAARVRATWAGVTYDIARGFADAWGIDYTPPAYSRVTLTCTDAFKVLANNDRAAAGAAGAGENTGARVGRILDSAGWPSADRIIDTGSSTLQATTLDGSALTELQMAVDSELGELYVDGAGRVVFRSRAATLTDTRSVTPQAVFGPAVGEHRYVTAAPDYDDTQLANKVTAAVVGGAEQTAADAASQAAYLIRTAARTDLILQTDADAASWAGFVLYISKDPELRFSALTINPRVDPADLYPQVLGRELGDRITVRLIPPGGGDPIERDCFIRGIEHTVGPMQWLTTWTLGSATKYSFLILDDATLGALDGNALSY
jgi:hypothetical protein